MQASDESKTLAKRALTHLNNRTTDQASSTMELPATAYIDPERYQREVDRVFRHLPLALAFSIELPGPKTYLAMTVVGVPVLMVRAEDGVVRAFLNICRHRGAQLCKPGRGTAQRLVCPYHAWQYDLKGKLTGIFGEATFGEVDRHTHSLTELSCAERSGMVWVNLTPGETFDIDEWLGEFGGLLDKVELDQWHVYKQSEFPGSGWKTTWDGYQECYHHGVLHPKTVGAYTITNLIVHDTYGPHQRMVFARRTLDQLNKVPEAQWDVEQHIRKVYLGFPNIAVSAVLGGHCLVNQVFPGPTPETTITRQTILVTKMPETEEETRLAEEFSDTVLRAIRDEDTPINQGILQGLMSGRSQGVVLGRNEPAVQHFHKTLAQLMKEESTEAAAP